MNNKNIEQEAEEYYIQFLFCKNRQLLLKEFRKLYDELFKIYCNIYREGKKQGIDLNDINKNFRVLLLGQKQK